MNSCSEPSVYTQETAAFETEFRASKLRCAPRYRYNDVNCLIIDNPNMGLYVLQLGLVLEGSLLDCSKPLCVDSFKCNYSWAVRKSNEDWWLSLQWDSRHCCVFLLATDDTQLALLPWPCGSSNVANLLKQFEGLANTLTIAYFFQGWGNTNINYCPRFSSAAKIMKCRMQTAYLHCAFMIFLTP